MIERITKALLLLQLTVATLIAAGASKVLHVGLLTGAGAGLATVLLVRLSIIANNFVLAWHYRSVTPPEHQIGPFNAIRLFFGEFAASMAASSWNMPFHRFHQRIVPGTATLPVLLIHGYGCNSGYWKAMSQALATARISHYAIDMEPVMGSIDDYVPLIHRAVEDICDKSSNEQLIIVAHSMGGLAVRAYFRQHGTDRVASAITLGTPHHGTALAHYGIGVNSTQMRWALIEEEEVASAWLRELAESENPDLRAHIVSLYSHHDNIIAPQISSYLPGATNIAYHGIGHVALASHPAIQQRVIEEIRRYSDKPNMANGKVA